MKKLIMVGVLLAAVPTLTLAATSKNGESTTVAGKNESFTTIANKSEPHSAVPITKNNKDKKKHEAAHAKSTQKSKEYYIKELQSEIEKAKSFVEEENKKKGALPVQYQQALVKLGVAEQWLEAIKSYQDPITRYVRSFNYGVSELNSAKRDMAVKTSKKPISDEKVKTGLEKLAKQSEGVLNDKKGITFQAENDVCFNKMIYSALKYIELANKPENRANFRHLTRRAQRYLSDAKKFIKEHKPRGHKKSDAKDAKTEVKSDTVNSGTATLGSSALVAAK